MLVSLVTAYIFLAVVTALLATVVLLTPVISYRRKEGYKVPYLYITYLVFFLGACYLAPTLGSVLVNIEYQKLFKAKLYLSLFK